MTQFSSHSLDCTGLFPGHPHWERPPEPSLVAGVREELLSIREPADDSKMTTEKPPWLCPSMLPHDRNVVWKGVLEVSHPASHSKRDCCQHWIRSAMALPQQILKTSRGGYPTTSLGICSTHILLILFLGTYPSPKQHCSTHRTITSRCFAIHPTPCSSRPWWPRNMQEVEHLLWELGSLSSV